MGNSIIKPKHATTSVSSASTKVLEKDEMLVISPDSGSGKGQYQIKFGDGVTEAKDLPVAINGTDSSEVAVKTFEEASDDNPLLTAGNTMKVLMGKIVKKFSYLEGLIAKKLNTSDIYTGLDSTSQSKVASASTVKQLNDSITQLNSNLSNKWSMFGAQLWTGNFTSGSITVPNAGKYQFFVMFIGYYPCFGTQYYGFGGSVGYNSYALDMRAYRFSVTAHDDKSMTFTINDLDRGGSNGTSNEPVQAIYGLIPL